MEIDDKKLIQLKQSIDVVLNYDLAKLRRENDIKRGILWNQIKNGENTFERELSAKLDNEERSQIIVNLATAKLLLAAAAKENGEKTPIIKKFSKEELRLVSDFERFNIFDILSVDEIADKMARREEIHDLAMDFYQNEYSRLDAMLESPEIQKDVKTSFKKRYLARLNKVGAGAQAYIAKYGVSAFVGQVEDKVKKNSEKGGTIAPSRDTTNTNPISDPQNISDTIGINDASGQSPELIIPIPILKVKKKIHLRAEWIAIILACISVSGYLVGFQLFPWLQSRNRIQSYTLIVNVLPSEMGTIQVSPLPNSSNKYPVGSRLTLEARETAGSHFVRWSGDAQGTLPVVVITMDSDKQVIAEFTSKLQSSLSNIVMAVNTTQVSKQFIFLNYVTSSSANHDSGWGVRCYDKVKEISIDNN